MVFILYSSVDLARLLDEDLDPPFWAELDHICESHGFWFENNDGYSYYSFPRPLRLAFLDGIVRISEAPEHRFKSTN